MQAHRGFESHFLRHSSEPEPHFSAICELLLDRNAVDNEAEVAAVLGGEARPAMRLAKLVEIFEELESQNLLAMSPNQIKKWRDPKKRALAKARH
ncbi:hypothetical protein [Mesorhizobium sp. Root102]|uniref:hypothetical protein n=1 Tax=Mesorhizobium sp. Root102 TaxID=1736422 RepID=UPI0009E8BE49|nr:hypothetical protein [Mesorhizobium sp. Root102]